MSPTYLAAIVSIIMGAQQFFGLDFTNEDWTAAIVVISGIIIALRQWLTGRSTFMGTRPKDYLS
jgi:type IV secretory pathway VirB2 component (pilin)